MPSQFRIQHFTFRTRPDFQLWSVVLSHGWSVLETFRIHRDDRSLSVATTLSGRPALVTMSQSGRSLRVSVEHRTHTVDRTAVTTLVQDILRTSVHLDQLYRLTDTIPDLRWVRRFGAGRILRAPTAFEDTVKTICTTNCSWALTTLMVKRLCDALGQQIGDRKTFPTPKAMADQTERFYRNEIRAGYRSPYLLEFAQRVADRELPIEQIRNPEISGAEKEAILSDIMGVGPYALDNLLRLHDVNDRFAHDSWITVQYADKYHRGRKVAWKTIERRYAPFGEWRGLVYWLDMTAEWYLKDIDFSQEQA